MRGINGACGCTVVARVGEGPSVGCRDEQIGRIAFFFRATFAESSALSLPVFGILSRNQPCAKRERGKSAEMIEINDG